MTKNKWRARITDACREAGTYRECFDDVIDTLADIMVRRDQAQKLFKESGGNVLILHINKAGQQNWEQNPALVMINALNRDALTYWRDLGLTPAGLRRINEDAMKAKPADSPFEASLKALSAV
jgi:hypothetical protein